MQYGLIIFDLDGTLVDTIEDLGNAVNAALEQRGLPLHTIPEYRPMVGHGIRNLVRNALPAALKNDEAFVDGCLASFKEYYSSHIDVCSKPYEGIPEMLRSLAASGVKLAVATNKFQAGAEKLLAKVFPGIRFSVISGDRPGMPLKPDPAVVLNILEQLGVQAAGTLYVGDSHTDIMTAQNAGVTSAGVSWGFRPKADLMDADHVLDDVASLSALCHS